MDPNFGYAYSGMKHIMGDLPPQAPVNEHSKKQALEAEEQRLPDTEWTVYSMDVGRLDHLYIPSLSSNLCFVCFVSSRTS
jgi:hypothetical protein